MRILVSVTTARKVDWRKQIEEVKKFKLNEIALFLTGLGYEQRQELYKELEMVNVEFIPHVHIRQDMTEDELQYLKDRYNVKAFNLHSKKCLKSKKPCFIWKHLVYYEKFCFKLSEKVCSVKHQVKK